MSNDLMIKENNRTVDQILVNQKQGFNVSERYVAISTQEVLDEIKSYTMKDPKIIGFNKRNVRKPGKQGFQGHAIIAEMPDSLMLDGTRINMILFNSNDRSSALKIHLGALRAACSNQLVFGTELFEPTSIRHTKKEWKDSIHTLMDNYAESQQAMHDTIQRMMSKYMSFGDQGRFAEMVANDILEPEIEGFIIDPSELNIAKRVEDKGKTLWTTFNRIQSSLVEGSINRIIKKEDDNGVLFDSVSKTHKLTDQAKIIKMNKQLHEAAMQFI